MGPGFKSVFSSILLTYFVVSLLLSSLAIWFWIKALVGIITTLIQWGYPTPKSWKPRDFPRTSWMYTDHIMAFFPRHSSISSSKFFNCLILNLWVSVEWAQGLSRNRAQYQSRCTTFGPEYPNREIYKNDLLEWTWFAACKSGKTQWGRNESWRLFLAGKASSHIVLCFWRIKWISWLVYPFETLK